MFLFIYAIWTWFCHLENKTNINDAYEDDTMEYQPDDLKSYIREHLEKYVGYHLERGYSPVSIKKALIRFGYSSAEIDDIIKNCRVSRHYIDKRYSEKDLDGETYYYLRAMIATYIKKQRDHGFDPKDVRAALIRYGHHRSLVYDSEKIIKPRRFIIGHNFVMWVSIILVVFFSFILGLALMVEPRRMIFVFSPAIIGLVLSSFAIRFMYKHKQYVPLLSAVVAIVLFFFMFPELESMGADSNVLIVLNTIVALVTTFFYSAFYTRKKAPEKRREQSKSRGQVTADTNDNPKKKKRLGDYLKTPKVTANLK